MSNEGMQTWTFCGHWENDRIVIDYVLDGDVQDDRIDTGEYEQGLWAAAASGLTEGAAEAAVIAEYEEAVTAEYEEVGLGAQQEAAALRVFGAMHGYTRD